MDDGLLKLLAENLPGLCWMANPDGYIFWYNRGWHEYCGTKPKDMEGWGWQSVHDPAVLPSVLDRWGASIASGEPFEMIFPLKGADGIFRPFLTRINPKKDDGGKVIWWFGTNTNISAQVDAEKALRESDARLRALNTDLEKQVAERTRELSQTWAVSSDLMGVLNIKGYFEKTNPAWMKTLGWSEDEIQTRKFVEFIHPDDRAAAYAAWDDAAKGKPAFSLENRYRTKDGQWRWLSWVAVPEGGKVYCTARDITADREAQEALALAQDALRQSQKMEAVGQLTGGIAHDFNNMLAIVIGSLDLLGRRIGDGDERSRRYLSNAKDGAERAALLTRRLLAFSRQQPLNPEAVDVNKLVSGMSELLRHSLGKDIQLETVLAGGMWQINADPNQLENVILNLAVNARDAMPDGGKLTIETQNAHIDDRYAAANVDAPAGQYVLIAVTDNGSGMSADVIAKAFDPFFTTKDIGKGTGLGLSQVYGFVKQSGGNVKIYSEVGRGTTIKIYLPRFANERTEEADKSGPENFSLADRKELVLAVDDEPLVRQFTVDALNELGYRVLEADSAATALHILDAHPDIALLFTDVIMPETNGNSLAALALKKRPDLKILFTTGYTKNAVLHNGVLDPSVNLIGKPFTINELAAKIRATLYAVPVG